MNSSDEPRPSVATSQNLQLNKRGGWRRWFKWIMLVVIVVAVVIGIAFWRNTSAQDNKPRYQSMPVTKGDLEITVSVTGKIHSVDAVTIGAEISGQVEEVYVQFNDNVTKGQVLAKINTEQLDARIKEAQAQAIVSQASVLSAQATAMEAKAEAVRMQSLQKRGLISQKDLDSALTAAVRAEAAVKSAKANQLASSAALESATSQRNKAIVRSPIDGVVLSRSVEPGQTVAASFQAPVLFIVAKDLTTMRLKAEVDEADVGKVKKGQRARFTVDAYPDKTFVSEVLSVKNTPSEGSDVVTYQAELTVDNNQLLLRPGMTATATIISTERKNVMLVPNLALRFIPLDVLAERTKDDKIVFKIGPSSRKKGGKAHGSSSDPAQPQNHEHDKKRQSVWMLNHDTPTSIDIVTGESDGKYTEVLEGNLSVGAELLVDVIIKDNS